MMTVKEKLETIIKDLPDDVASQIYKFALFLKNEMDEERELIELSESPAFKRLAKRSLTEIQNNETLSLDELKEEIKR